MSNSLQFIVCSQASDANVAEKLGSAEYSYHFVLKGYLPLLRKLGEVVEVENPAEDVDKVYRQACEQGKRCVFLHFTAPHNMISGIECPTLLVFAWEYNTIPTEHWGNNGKHDWRVGLSSVNGAIVLSEHTVSAVKNAMGEDYAVASIPTPVFDGAENLRLRNDRLKPVKRLSVEFSGMLVDSRDIALVPHVLTAEEAQELSLNESRYSYFLYLRGLELDAKDAELSAREQKIRNEEITLDERLRASHTLQVEDHLAARNTVRFALGTLKRALFRQALPKPEFELLKSSIEASGKELEQADDQAPEKNFDDLVHEDPVNENCLFAEGVIYTTVLNPLDLRKNWQDMLTAFCTAFRDKEDAVLVIKVSVQFITRFSDELIDHLRRLHRFSCRVVIIKSHLSDEEYARLMSGTSFYVNTSFGEGQCIPLTEALAAGIPAIAPSITAMEEYVNTDCCLVPGTHIEPTYWQQDPRKSYRAVHHKISWPDLVDAFKTSYEIASNDADRYSEMSNTAIESIKRYSSTPVLEHKLASFLDNVRLN
ncbi:MAG: glycosyltransferase [Pseudomonadales bacterium]